MMASINMSSVTYALILRHLFPSNDKREHGGFLFCRFDAKQSTFECIEWMPLMSTDYAEQESDCLELSDEARGKIIKKAHDMGASLVELHCHPGPSKAAFSLADWAGFREFVPHIRWRLKKKPYAALVFAHNSFDGFAWADDRSTPTAVSVIQTELNYYPATGISIDAMNRGMYGKI